MIARAGLQRQGSHFVDSVNLRLFGLAVAN